MRLMKKPTLGVIVLAAVLSGCAAETSEGPVDEDLARASEAALSASSRHDLWKLSARAVYDASNDTTAITLDTRDPTDPRILTDRFIAVMVYRDRGNGVREALATLRANQIGPGGGCIHFQVPAKTGELLFIGAVIKLTGMQGAQLGAVPDGVVVVRD